MTIFVAQDLKPGKASPMEDERIECRWFRLAEINRLIAGGEIQDGKTIIGTLAWQRFRKKPSL
jgi:ADP-ribose pyrophosphatase